jgi:hypothetical protein
MRETLQLLDRELWLAQRLAQHGIELMRGDTTIESRRQHARDAIGRVGASTIAAAGKDRKPRTYAQAFEWVYEQPL